jgi:hypothetical protein
MQAPVGDLTTIVDHPLTLGGKQSRPADAERRAPANQSLLPQSTLGRMRPRDRHGLLAQIDRHKVEVCSVEREIVAVNAAAIDSLLAADRLWLAE